MMNRSQKFLGITLMASLLCGFTPMQSEAKEYKIGGMYTYDYHDGRHADWGEYELHAAKMAIEDINASGMLGGNTLNMPPELVIDYHCWPEGAAEKARSLLKQNIVALTGVDCSGPAVLIAKEAEKFKTPVVSVGANAASLSSPTEFPYYYRNVTPSTKYEGYLLEVAKLYDIKEIALFHTTDAWGSGAAAVILNEAAKLGIEVKASYGYSRNTPVEEVQKRMAAVKELGIKSIFITMPTPDTVIAFRTLTNLGMNQPGYSLFAAEMTSADERPDAINGAFGYLAPMTKLVPSKALDEFAARFSKKIGKKVDMNSKAFFYGVLSYDHMMALGLAMKNVQDQKLEMNGDTLMASLRALSFDGLSGRQNLAPGTNDREIMAVEIMNCQGYKEDGKTVRFVPVGFVDSVTDKLTIEEDKILWPGKTSTPPNR